MKGTRISLKLGDVEVVFRVPTVPDGWAVYGSLPLLPTEATPAPRRDPNPSQAEIFARRLEGIDFADRWLAQCAIAPKLLRESVLDPGDRICLPEVPADDRLAAVTELFKAAGFTTEAGAALDPTSPTGGGSPTSIESGVDTESVPATSSVG